MIGSIAMQQEENAGDDNVHAGKLEAMWHLIFAATTPEEFEQAKKQAAQIAAMSEEEVGAMVNQTPPEEGDMIRHMRG